MKTKEPKRTGLTVSELLDPDKIKEIEAEAWQRGGHGPYLGQLKTKNNNHNDKE